MLKDVNICSKKNKMSSVLPAKNSQYFFSQNKNLKNILNITNKM